MVVSQILVYFNMIFGTTLSHLHLSYLKIDFQLALENLLELDLQIIRLGVYWNQYDPKTLSSIISFLEKHNKKIVLVVGEKSPRWPEFYTRPEGDILSFTSSCVQFFKKHQSIIAWQVENEPLDPSGPSHKIISKTLLQNQIDLVKSLDTRPIIFTLWGNTLSSRKILHHLPNSINIIGLDLYPKVPISSYLSITSGPKDSPESIKKIMQTTNKTFWITELQAESWAPFQLSSIDILSNIKYAQILDPQVCLLWGFEYWLGKKLSGDTTLWNSVKSYL